jgi:hypothetical protein
MSFNRSTKSKLLRQRVWSVTVAALCWAQVVHAQPAQQERALEVRVTGSLVPVTADHREDVVTVKVFIHEQAWLLRVGMVEKLTATERERMVDDGVLMRQVRLYGPDDLLSRLQRPEMIDKAITIEGHLDTTQKRLRVTAVKEGGASTPQPLRRE